MIQFIRTNYTLYLKLMTRPYLMFCLKKNRNEKPCVYLYCSRKGIVTIYNIMQEFIHFSHTLAVDVAHLPFAQRVVPAPSPIYHVFLFVSGAQLCSLGQPVNWAQTFQS